MDATPTTAEVLVVGAGSAGCALAGRLASAGVDVLLLERGGQRPAPPWWSLSGGFDPATSVGDELEVPGRPPQELRRGIGVGGSGAVNGAYFVHAPRRDLLAWASVGGDPWSVPRLERLRRGLERDLDRPADPHHGHDGPVPVQRDPVLEPISEAFVAACLAVGSEWNDDLNGSEPDGVGLVPFARAGATRATPASAYLGPSGIGVPRVWAGAHARRLLLSGARVEGVEVGRGRDVVPVLAGCTVLCAGSVGSAELLLRSGLGRALPGLGAASTNHPFVDVPVAPRAGATRSTPANLLQCAWYPPSEDGSVVEVLATRRPYGVVTGADPADRLLSMRVTLLTPRARGRLREVGGRVRLDACRPGDEAAFRDDVATLAGAAVDVARLLAGPELSPFRERVDVPGVAVPRDPADAPGWVRERLGYSFHLCSTAPVGASPDAGAVVGPDLAVHGVEGLRLADAAVLPSAPSRGPAATAALVGELAAELLLTDRRG